MFDYYISLEAGIDAREKVVGALDALLDHSPTIDVGRVIMTVMTGHKSPLFFYNSVARIRSEKDATEMIALLKSVTDGSNGAMNGAGRRTKVEFKLLLAVPSGATEIDAQLLPEDPCVRPLLIELAEHAGANIDVRKGFQASGLRLNVGRLRFGAAPVTLFRDPASKAIRSRAFPKSHSPFGRQANQPKFL